MSIKQRCGLHLTVTISPIGFEHMTKNRAGRRPTADHLVCQEKGFRISYGVGLNSEMQLISFYENILDKDRSLVFLVLSHFESHRILRRTVGPDRFVYNTHASLRGLRRRFSIYFSQKSLLCSGLRRMELRTPCSLCEHWVRRLSPDGLLQGRPSFFIRPSGQSRMGIRSRKSLSD